MPPEENKINLTQEMDVKDDVDFLNEEETKPEEEIEKPPEVKPPDEKSEEEEEKPEEEESEEEEKEDEEEEEEDKEESPEFLANRPTWSEINKKYPNFFKDFPQMKHVIGREMEYSKVFPTVEEAKEAAESAEDYQYIEDKFKEGNSKEVLDIMKESDQNSYSKFVNEFLPTLYQNDNQAYFEVVTPVIHNLLHQIYSSAKDENLKNATLVLSDHLFNDMNKIERPAEVKRVESKTQNNEHQEYLQQRLKDARSDVDGETLNSIQEMIMDSIVKQFPDGKVPKNLESVIVDIVDNGVTRIARSLVADESYMRLMKSLWKRAYNSGFTGDWKERIVNAYLSRAKELIPGISRKVTPFVPRKVERSERRIPNSREHKPTGNSTPSAKEIDWNRTSDRDFLEDNIKVKGD